MHIVLLETTRYRGFDVVAELARHGVSVTFVTADLDFYRDKPGFAAYSQVRDTVHVEGYEPAALATTVRAALADRPADGIVCLTDAHLVSAARLAAALDLPHERIAALELVADKAMVRTRLAECGIGTVRWAVARSPDELRAVAAEISYPVVVKPTSGSGSVGVRTLWEPHEQFEENYPVLVEQRLSGLEVSAEAVVCDGTTTVLGFAQRVPVPAGVAAELGGHFPAEFDGIGAARTLVTEVVDAIGLRRGFLHVELMITPTGPELVELNARPAGHVVVRQMSLALGRSIELEIARLAAGLPVARDTAPVATLALRHFSSFTPGTVSSIDRSQWPAAAAAGDHGARIVDIGLGAEIGHRVNALRSNRDRFGHVLTAGQTAAEAIRVAETVRASVRVAPDHGDRPSVHAVGPHLLVILDGTISVDRLWASVGSVTGHVSVVWSGVPGEGHDFLGDPGDDNDIAVARRAWQARFTGEWRVASPEDVVAAAATIHRTDPIQGVCGFSADSLAAAASLRQALDPASTRPHGITTASAWLDRVDAELDGRIVLGIVRAGRLRTLAVCDDRTGRDNDDHSGGGVNAGHVLLAYPSGLSDDQVAVLEAAAHRVADRLVDGPMWLDTERAVNTTTARARAGLPSTVLAIADAVCGSDVVTEYVRSALGQPEPRARRVPAAAAALLRALPTPTGRFRAISIPEPAELRAHADVSHVDPQMTPGGVATHDDQPNWMSYVVSGTSLAACEARARHLESGLRPRFEQVDTEHVLVLDRVGGVTCTDHDGAPLLPAGDYRTTVLSGAALAAWQRSAQPAALFLLDVFDDDRTATVADAVHHNHPVHRVAAASERLLVPAAALRERLGVPGRSVAETRRYTDKSVMKRLARAGGVRCAAGVLAHDPDDVRGLYDKYGAVVVKPRSGSGSRQVTICRTAAAVESWLDTDFVPDMFLAEEFVSGDVCHIDAIVAEGEVLAWDVSRYLRDTFALRRGLPLSSRTVADPAVRTAAADLLAGVVAAWQVRDDVLHVEAFLAGDGLVFCELAGRPGGAGVVEAFRFTRGYDLRHAKILLDSGADVRCRRIDPVAEHAGWTVHYATGGKLVEYDDATVAPLAAARSVSASVGSTVRASAYSGTGLGKYVFTGPTEDHVRTLIDRAEQEVTIRFDKVDATS